MAKIAFVCPYFGKLPEHINFWLKTISFNKNHTFFLITDDETPLLFPENVKAIYMGFPEFKKKCQDRFNFRISLDSVRKIGDYKPALGYIFENMITGFDAWGHVDVADEWYGQISKFITNDILRRYEKIMLLGHMTIYRNTPETNRRFMMKSKADYTYKEVYSSPHFFNFEELVPGSVNQIFIDNHIPITQLNDSIADLTDKTHAFKRAFCFDFETGTFHGFDENIPVYSWEQGHVYGYELKNSNINKKEMLYIHIKRRKIDIEVDVNADSFLIVPNRFIPFEPVTIPLLEKYSVDIKDNVKRRKRVINSAKYHIENGIFNIKRKIIPIKVEYFNEPKE